MALDVFEKIAADGGVGDISRFFDHVETITQASLDQVKALGGSVSVQNRDDVPGPGVRRAVPPGGVPELPQIL